ncbi:hypothetical protein PTKIN_Ptkin10aG0066500 [Pterospermum kingtungense]
MALQLKVRPSRRALKLLHALIKWYLKRVDNAFQEAKALSNGGRLSLIGQLTGGWLARIYMEELRVSHISLLLTLGTPHFSFFYFNIEYP